MDRDNQIQRYFLCLKAIAAFDHVFATVVLPALYAQCLDWFFLAPGLENAINSVVVGKLAQSARDRPLRGQGKTRHATWVVRRNILALAPGLREQEGAIDVPFLQVGEETSVLALVHQETSGLLLDGQDRGL